MIRFIKNNKLVFIFFTYLIGVFLGFGIMVQSKKELHGIYIRGRDFIYSYISPGIWVKVNKNYIQRTCSDFCYSLDLSCSGYGCSEDVVCGINGGLLQLETWDKSVGVSCKNSWEGQCDTPMEEYPPFTDYRCCCR